VPRWQHHSQLFLIQDRESPGVRAGLATVKIIDLLSGRYANEIGNRQVKPIDHLEKAIVSSQLEVGKMQSSIRPNITSPSELMKPVKLLKSTAELIEQF
jgi:hypothetical protein